MHKCNILGGVQVIKNLVIKSQITTSHIVIKKISLQYSVGPWLFDLMKIS